MKKKLSVLFIIATLAVCVLSFTACVENAPKDYDMYGDFYVGTYDAGTGKTAITDYTKCVTLGEKDGKNVAYVDDSEYYADYDLIVKNTIELKRGNRWGEVVYTINVVTVDVLQIEFIPQEADGEGNIVDGESVTYTFVRYEA